MGPVAPGAGRGREGRVRRPAVGVSTGRCSDPFADRSAAVARLPRVSGPCRAHAGGRVGPDPTRVGRAACLLQRQSVECRRDEGAHLFGVTIFNDFSARDLQATASRTGMGPAPGKDWANALGPCIVTRDEFGELRDQAIAVRVNNEGRLTMHGPRAFAQSFPGAGPMPVRLAVAWRSRAEKSLKIVTPKRWVLACAASMARPP